MLMERLTYLAGALPSIVVALALITVTIRFARPIYQSAITLIAAYVLLFLPQGDGHPAGRAAAGAARARGCRPRARRRTSRHAAPGGAATGRTRHLLRRRAGVYRGATELTATLLLSPIGTTTLATRFWSLAGSIDYVQAAPYAAMMIIISAPVTYLLLQQSRGCAADERGASVSVLRVTGIEKSFNGVPVLRGVSLDVAAGGITAILGPSGCGKTTLLRLVAGFLRPDGGIDRDRRATGQRTVTGRFRPRSAGWAISRRRARCSRT